MQHKNFSLKMQPKVNVDKTRKHLKARTKMGDDAWKSIKGELILKEECSRQEFRLMTHNRFSLSFILSKHTEMRHQVEVFQCSSLIVMYNINSYYPSFVAGKLNMEIIILCINPLDLFKKLIEILSPKLQISLFNNQSQI